MTDKDFIIEDGVLTKYTGSGESVTVPDGTAAIGSEAFRDNASILEVTIPPGVETIADSAFLGCQNLKRVTFPFGLKEIENHAFQRCSSLEEVRLPGSLKRLGHSAFSPCAALRKVFFEEGAEYIGEFAFSGCANLSEVTFPETLSSIDRSAFSMCTSLTSLSLPSSLERINRGTFLGCSSLKEISLGPNVYSVENSAFYNCSSLLAVNVDKDNPFLKSIDGVLYNREGNTLLYFPGGRLEIVIPESVTSIGDEAFYENLNFDTVTLPSRLSSIGNRSFYRCGELISIEFPESLARIGESSFEGCSRLTRLYFPDGMRKIGESSFRRCPNLAWIRVPHSMDFDIHWFSAPNDPPAFSADHTVIPYVTGRPISDIESSIGARKACEGLIAAERAGIKEDAVIEAGYTDRIRGQISDYYEGMLKDADMLAWLLDRRLVPEEDIETLLERASDSGRADACAMLLDYKAGKTARQVKAPAVDLDARFDALSKALDF